MPTPSKFTEARRRVVIAALGCGASRRTAATLAGVRVASILAAKGGAAGDYWRGAGRARFERELADDGLAPERIDAVILIIDDFVGPDLDAILRDLRARHA